MAICRAWLQRQAKWWREQDSNLRTLSRAELQSAAINHSTIPPRKKVRARQISAVKALL